MARIDEMYYADRVRVIKKAAEIYLGLPEATHGDEDEALMDAETWYQIFFTYLPMEVDDD